MKLTNEQINSFKELGYVFIENAFDSGEVKKMNDELPRLYNLDREEIQKEKDGKAIRTVFAAHKFSDIYSDLSRHPRIVKPAMQLLGGDLYIHQFKINAKEAFDGDLWQWHQDYGTWKNDDEMPEGLALNVGLFLDDVTQFNGPLNFIPKSHRDGYIEAKHDTTTTSYPLWTINNETISKLVKKGGIVAPEGKAGSMILFDSTLVHGSPSNMSPWNRTIVYISLNRTSNYIKKFNRPEYKAHRDFSAIKCVDDACFK
jgi:ectoine hydroxylase